MSLEEVREIVPVMEKGQYNLEEDKNKVFYLGVYLVTGSLQKVKNAIRMASGAKVTDYQVRKFIEDNIKIDEESIRFVKSVRDLNAFLEKDFLLPRQNINPLFHHEYITGTDGIIIGPKVRGNRISYPAFLKEMYAKGGIVPYVRAGDFGWFKVNPRTGEKYKVKTLTSLHRDRFSDGTPVEKGKDWVDVSFKGSFLRGIKADYIRSITAGYEKYLTDESYRIAREKNPNFDNLKAIERGVLLKKIRKELKEKYDGKFNELIENADKTAEKIYNQLEIDPKSVIYFGRNYLNKRLCPIFASKSKKDRGKQRMFAYKDFPFSRAALNLPFLEYSHPKRISMIAHECSKSDVYLSRYNRKVYEIPKYKLLRPEKPVVKAVFNDIPGINLNTRLPRNNRENLLTKEGGMIITEGAAKKFEYLSSTPIKELVVEDESDLYPATRLNKPLTELEEYEKIIKTPDNYFVKGDILGRKLVRRPMKIVDQNIYEPPAEGYLVYIGSGRKKNGEKYSKIVDGKKVEYIKQKYQIVRKMPLVIGDKLEIRGGLKGVVSDIVPDGSLGVNNLTGEKFEAVINHADVWQESSDPIEDKVMELSAKKRGAIVKEWLEGNGKIFYFLGGKFTVDNPFKRLSGLSLSWTFLSGLLEKLEKMPEEVFNYTVRSFVSSNDVFKAVLKTLHKKIVKNEDGSLSIVKDLEEPKEDSMGKVIKLKHTWGRHKYEYCYVPKFIPQTYFDGEQLQIIYNNVSRGDFSDQKSYNMIVKRALKFFNPLPKYRDVAFHLITVPGEKENEVVVSGDLLRQSGLSDGEYLFFRKEPVTSASSILFLKVRGDDRLPFGVIRINPYVAKEGVIDFDGDTVVATPMERLSLKYGDKKIVEQLIKAFCYGMPEESKRKLLSEGEILRKDPDYFGDKWWFDKKNKLSKIKKTTDEIVRDCVIYHEETFSADNQEIQQLGGLRARCNKVYEPNKWKVEDIDGNILNVDLELINDVTNVEKVMKAHESKLLLGKFDEYIEKYENNQPMKIGEYEYTPATLPKHLKISLNSYKIRKQLDKFVREETKKSPSPLDQFFKHQEEMVARDVSEIGGEVDETYKPVEMKISQKRPFEKLVISTLKVM